MTDLNRSRPQYGDDIGETENGEQVSLSDYFNKFLDDIVLKSDEVDASIADLEAVAIALDTSNFNGLLSATEDTTQKALDLLDDITLGATDHGALTGLSDDDHTQYVLANGSRALTVTTTNFNGILSGTENTLQKALDKLDDHTVVEGWTDVGSGGGAPAFVNSWVNYGTPFQVARFKVHQDVLSIQGLVKSGTLLTTIFTLPVGYRPNKYGLHSTVSASGAARIDVLPSGAVIMNTGSSASFTSLEITMRID